MTVSSPGGSLTSDAVILSVSDELSQQWSVAYNGPANAEERDPLLQITPNGDLVLAGTSDGLSGGRDMVTARYTSDGIERWVRRYDGPAGDTDEIRAMTTDQAGNVYVCGSGSGDADVRMVTIKYDAAGSEQWVREYADPDVTRNMADSMAVDGSGNVLVAGRSGEQWVVRGANAGFDESKVLLAVDGAGNSYVGATTHRGDSEAFLIVKFDPDGGERWSRTYGEMPVDELADLALDSGGNVVVAGHGYAEDGGRLDVIVLKYDSVGTILWAKSYDVLPSQFDFARSMEVDVNDNIFVASSVENDDDDKFGSAVAKYDADGNRLWLAFEADHELRDTSRFAVDGSGKVYVTGQYYHPSVGVDVRTVRYDSDGQREWIADFGTPGLTLDAGVVAAVDGEGAVYVAGLATGRLGARSDLVLLKYGTEPPLLQLTIEQTGDGGIRLVVLNELRGEIAMEASSDLKNWTRMEGKLEGGAVIELSAAKVSEHSHRFYRLVRVED